MGRNWIFKNATKTIIAHNSFNQHHVKILKISTRMVLKSNIGARPFFFFQNKKKKGWCWFSHFKIWQIKVYLLTIPCGNLMSLCFVIWAPFWSCFKYDIQHIYKIPFDDDLLKPVKPFFFYLFLIHIYSLSLFLQLLLSRPLWLAFSCGIFGKQRGTILSF